MSEDIDDLARRLRALGSDIDHAAAALIRLRHERDLAAAAFEACHEGARVNGFASVAAAIASARTAEARATTAEARAERLADRLRSIIDAWESVPAGKISKLEAFALINRMHQPLQDGYEALAKDQPS